MSIASLANVLSVFSGAEPNPEQRQQLVHEVLLMTLARASSSDTNVQPVEVTTVQKIMRDATGVQVSAADVRVSAHSALFETTPLDTALSRVRHQLNSEDRVLIALSLAKVIRSDLRISPMETPFFDQVTRALDIPPSELAGLVPGEI
jgi:uncharacterized tellurite resistance protein B-like protein